VEAGVSVCPPEPKPIAKTLKWGEASVEEKEKLLSIGEMAEFARIARSVLLYYDKMDLISPIARKNHNYRYYSYRQIGTSNLIVTMQRLGFSLENIKNIIRTRTPENMVDLFSKQSQKIGQRIEKLAQVQKLLNLLKDTIESGLVADETKIELRETPAESIFLGPPIDYSKGKTIEEATLDFYRHCRNQDKDMDLNYPVWGVFSEERIKKRDWVWPDRFYFQMPDAPDSKPAGLYLTGYTRGYYGQTDSLYERLMAHIGEHRLEICGPAYETYPLNEISIKDPDNYLIRVSVTVKPR
jgi:DNA-binding transcriptional MerR regulator